MFHGALDTTENWPEAAAAQAEAVAELSGVRKVYGEVIAHGFRPRAKTAKPAEPYLAAGAEQARRLGHSYVGTEHVLLVLIRNPDGGASAVLRQLGVSTETVEERLVRWLGTSKPKIDPEALAALGIDLETVRERLEQTFGPGALQRTPTCLGICPRLKMALAYAVDHADGHPVTDEHIVLGMLSVPECVAARVLTEPDVR